MKSGGGSWSIFQFLPHAKYGMRYTLCLYSKGQKRKRGKRATSRASYYVWVKKTIRLVKGATLFIRINLQVSSKYLTQIRKIRVASFWLIVMFSANDSHILFLINIISSIRFLELLLDGSSRINNFKVYRTYYYITLLLFVQYPMKPRLH